MKQLSKDELIKLYMDMVQKLKIVPVDQEQMNKHGLACIRLQVLEQILGYCLDSTPLKEASDVNATK